RTADGRPVRGAANSASGRLVARRSRRAVAALHVVGLRGRQRHRPGGRSAAAVSLAHDRAGGTRSGTAAADASARAATRHAEPVADRLGTLVPDRRLSRTNRQRLVKLVIALRATCLDMPFFRSLRKTATASAWPPRIWTDSERGRRSRPRPPQPSLSASTNDPAASGTA